MKVFLTFSDQITMKVDQVTHAIPPRGMTTEEMAPRRFWLFQSEDKEQLYIHEDYVRIVVVKQ